MQFTGICNVRRTWKPYQRPNIAYPGKLHIRVDPYNVRRGEYLKMASTPKKWGLAWFSTQTAWGLSETTPPVQLLPPHQARTSFSYSWYSLLRLEWMLLLQKSQHPSKTLHVLFVPLCVISRTICHFVAQQAVDWTSSLYIAPFMLRGFVTWKRLKVDRMHSIQANALIAESNFSTCHRMLTNRVCFSSASPHARSVWYPFARSGSVSPLCNSKGLHLSFY